MPSSKYFFYNTQREETHRKYEDTKPNRHLTLLFEQDIVCIKMRLKSCRQYMI